MLDRCKRGVKPRCIDCRHDGVYTAECGCRTDYVETQHASETGVFLSVDGSAGSKRFHTTKHHLSPAATGLDASHAYVAFRHCIDLHPLPPYATFAELKICIHSVIADIHGHHILATRPS